MKLALIALALAVPVGATTPGAAALMKELEGVYRHEFHNKIVVAGKLSDSSQVEDVIDIMRYDDQHAFVRASVHVGKGHRCSVQGVAAFENNAFVYRDPEPPLSGTQCTLRIARVGDKLVLDDRVKPATASTCSGSCGARSSLGQYSIDLRKKTALGNPARIKGSKEYAKAVKAFEDSRR